MTPVYLLWRVNYPKPAASLKAYNSGVLSLQPVEPSTLSSE